MTVIEPIKDYFDYDDETLGHLHDVYEMMLKDFNDICDENDIEYFCAYGTALGAIRHNGFIPWDDDVDILMTYDEFVKFFKVMSNNKKYELYCLENKDDYCYLFAKLTLKQTKLIDKFHMNNKGTYDGIFFDIFILSNAPDNKLKFKLYALEKWIINRTLWIENVTSNDIYVSRNKEIMGRFIRFFFKLFRINKKNLKKISKNFLKKYEGRNCESFCDLAAPYKLKCIPKSIMSPSKKIKFESIEVNVPNDHDAYLKIIYGDYMKLPPENERRNHSLEIDFGPY